MKLGERRTEYIAGPRVRISHKAVTPWREKCRTFKMLVIFVLCGLIAASPSWCLDDDWDPERNELLTSELGRRTEELLNCFMQLDRSLTDKWTSRYKLNDNLRKSNNGTVEPEARERLPTSELKNCMGNLTAELKKNPGLEKCLKDLVSTELENESIISSAALFDETLPVQFRVFLNYQELLDVLSEGKIRMWIMPEFRPIQNTVKQLIDRDASGADKAFLIDQACEWRDLAELEKREGDWDRMLEEFKDQVLRSVSIQVAHSVFGAKDLKPGTWVTVYRRWIPARARNLKDLNSIMGDLMPGTFTTEHLCKYATILASFFAEEEIKVLLAERVSPLRLVTTDYNDKSRIRELDICANGESTECLDFRRFRHSIQPELRCIETFGELMSNHFLYSIVQRYVQPQNSLTYPEIVCKNAATSTHEHMAVRYCRCAGSFCTINDVGELKANMYKLVNGNVVLNRT